MGLSPDPVLRVVLLLPLALLTGCSLEDAPWLGVACAGVLLRAVLIAVKSARDHRCGTPRARLRLLKCLSVLLPTLAAAVHLTYVHYPVLEEEGPTTTDAPPSLFQSDFPSALRAFLTRFSHLLTPSIVSSSLNIALVSLCLPFAGLLVERMRREEEGETKDEQKKKEKKEEDKYKLDSSRIAVIAVLYMGVGAVAAGYLLREDGASSRLRSGLFAVCALLKLAVGVLCAALRDAKEKMNLRVLLWCCIGISLTLVGTAIGATTALIDSPAVEQPQLRLLQLAAAVAAAATLPPTLLAHWLSFQKDARTLSYPPRAVRAIAVVRILVRVLSLGTLAAAFCFGYTSTEYGGTTMEDGGEAAGAVNRTTPILSSLLPTVSAPSSSSFLHFLSFFWLMGAVAVAQGALAYVRFKEVRLARVDMAEVETKHVVRAALAGTLAVIAVAGEISLLVVSHLHWSSLSPARLGLLCWAAHALQLLLTYLLDRLRKVLRPFAVHPSLVLFAACGALILYGELTQCFPGQPPAPPTVWLAASLALATALQLAAIPAVECFKREAEDLARCKKALAEAFREDLKQRIEHKRREKEKEAEDKERKREEKEWKKREKKTFGQPAAGTSLFGAPAASAAPSAFSFGAPATSTAGAFGTGTTFGQPAASAGTTSLFGAKPATTSAFSFGNTTTTTASPFGATAAQPATTGLFGAKPATTFGAAPTGGLFGQPAAAQPSTGLFGQPAAQPTTGMFGQPATMAAAQPVVQQVAAAPIELVTNMSQAQMEMTLIKAQLEASPYGDSPLFNLKEQKKDTDERPNPTSVQRQLKFLASKKDSPLTTSTSMNGSTPSGAAAKQASQMSKVLDLSVGATPGRSPLTTKDLVYSPSVLPPTLGRGLRSGTPAMHNSSMLNHSRTERSMMRDSVDASIEASLRGNGANRLLARDPDELPRRADGGSGNVLSPLQAGPADGFHAHAANLHQRQPPTLNLDVTSETVQGSPARTPAAQKENAATGAAAGASPLASSSASRSPRGERLSIGGVKEVPGTGVRLVQPDYYTIPSIEAMRDLVRDGRVVLPDGLTIGRHTFGTVFWAGRLELADVTVDEIVVFRNKEVTVYPDQTKKPPLGQGFNRPAEITLEQVWPIDKKTKEEVKDAVAIVNTNWREKLEKTTARMDADFKDFRPLTGSWVFRVKHFSKYGLPDDDSEEEDGAAASAMKENLLHASVQRAKMAGGDAPPPPKTAAALPQAAKDEAAAAKAVRPLLARSIEEIVEEEQMGEEEEERRWTRPSEPPCGCRRSSSFVIDDL